MVRPEEERSQIDEWNRTEAGEKDSQITLRGYRVDWGDRGAAEGIRRSEGSVVVAREEVQEEKRFGGVLHRCRDGGRKRPAAECGGRAARLPASKLAEYMVPTWYVRLERLPLTENGKVDRKRCPLRREKDFAVRWV